MAKDRPRAKLVPWTIIQFLLRRATSVSGECNIPLQCNSVRTYVQQSSSTLQPSPGEVLQLHSLLLDAKLVHTHTKGGIEYNAGKRKPLVIKFYQVYDLPKWFISKVASCCQ